MTNRNKETQAPMLIEEENLSYAWGRALLEITDNGGTEITPLVISITGFDDSGKPLEDPAIREALDDLLTRTGKWIVDKVAFTIFPQQCWKIVGGNRKMLYELYRDTFPRFQAMNRRDNGKGLYFERLTMFDDDAKHGNQLEFIINEYNTRGGRRSKYQASIFDPKRDHNSSPYNKFPCMQHLSFVPTASGLVVNAFYAKQDLFQRAYGNYLGLAHLGAFMASEMNMKMSRLNVYVGIEQLEVTKGAVAVMAEVVRSRISK